MAERHTLLANHALSLSGFRR